MHPSDDFTIAATGDSIITRPVVQYEEAVPQFGALLDVLRSTTVTATQLEVLLHEYQHPPADTDGRVHMHADPHLVDELVDMGCDLFGTASNHTFDYGTGGIRSTITELNERNLPFAGIGETLFEAREPCYHETPHGRVAMISASTSISPESEASARTEALPGRPGLNPLGVNAIHRITEENMEKLKQVGEAVGFESIKADAKERRMFHASHGTDDYYHFDELTFELVDDPAEMGIRYEVDDENRTAILEWIEEATATAEWVIMSLHSHQGADGFRNTETTPEFLRKFARSCIDAGADMFVGTGPHLLRGIEMYDGRPVFYSLGNFVFQLETMRRLSSKIYDLYDVEDETKVSQVFDSWFRDEAGEARGYLGDEAFWESVVPVVSFSDSRTIEDITLHPISLQRSERPSKRGVPLLAEGESAIRILEAVRRLSSEFDTEIVIDEDDEKASIPT